MGDINKMLEERVVGPGMYGDTARIEIEEAIHFHLDEYRFLWSKERFLEIADLFKEAVKRFEQEGSPEETSPMIALSVKQTLPSKFAPNRCAVELEENGTIHFHLRDFRIHMNEGDLVVLYEIIENAYNNLIRTNGRLQTIPLNEIKDYHEVVNQYVNWLKEYKEGVYNTPPEDFLFYKNQMILQKTSVGDFFKRNKGFPDDFPGDVDIETDRNYLFSLYNDIVENGIRNPLLAYKIDGGIKIISSHRFAIQKYMKVDPLIVCVVEPESN